MSTRFARRLRELRERQQVSQVRFADWVECNRTYLSHLEAGRRSPGREIVERIIMELDLRSDDADQLRLDAGFAPQAREVLILDGCVVSQALL